MHQVCHHAPENDEFICTTVDECMKCSSPSLLSLRGVQEGQHHPIYITDVNNRLFEMLIYVVYSQLVLARLVVQVGREVQAYPGVVIHCSTQSGIH